MHTYIIVHTPVLPSARAIIHIHKFLHSMKYMIALPAHPSNNETSNGHDFKLSRVAAI